MPRAFRSSDASSLRAVPAGRVIRGTVAPPPSKSVTHRYLSLALLGGRECRVERPLLAEDTELYLQALDGLGWTVAHRGEDVLLTPAAEHVERAELFCGNAGTMFRFLTAILTALPGRFRLDGTPRLRERPVGPLLATLRSLGARVDCPEQAGHAPLELEGTSLRGGRAVLDAGQSSQYLSALLLACLRAPRPTRLEVTALTSSPYVELTRESIRRAISGADPVADRSSPEDRGGAGIFEITPGAPSAERLAVEADLSAACYPAAGAALTGGAVEISGVRRESAQGDRRFFDLLEQMGASVSWRDEQVEVRGDRPLEAPGAVDLSGMPDQVPTLAALAPFAAGVTRIENVHHLRIKESDRLRAMAEGLSRLGVPIEERPDGLVIPGCWSDAGAVVPGDRTVIYPRDDHRIAMSFALVGLRREGVVVADPAVVGKSYPAFWDDFDTLLG